MSMATPWWATIALALVGPVGILLGQWLGARAARRTQALAARTARDDQARIWRRASYAGFVRAGRAAQSALRREPAGDEAATAVAELRAVAAEVELGAPERVRARLLESLEAADRWCRVGADNTPSSAPVTEAAERYAESLGATLAVMRSDVGLDAVGTGPTRDPATAAS